MADDFNSAPYITASYRRMDYADEKNWDEIRTYLQSLPGKYLALRIQDLTQVVLHGEQIHISHVSGDFSRMVPDAFLVAFLCE